MKKFLLILSLSFLGLFVLDNLANMWLMGLEFEIEWLRNEIERLKEENK